MNKITESGAILVETLSRYISNYEHARIDIDALEDLLSGDAAIARRILILAGMKPSSGQPDIWGHGSFNSRFGVDLTDDLVIAAIVADWAREGA
ncbi:hypothetical protein [Ruegeria arenilitoris]|uniref:Uncharacterized protein n=1 Tax=Ruegeria arenilitoris TaxID=1173585 RepID=A0A238K0S4_9RHOB|nr:hypothetical protein [Ruegeria arenilitoris]SMX36485.1 hypothetical protein RUA8715_01415 [Ruegeria arenilitoris]